MITTLLYKLQQQQLDSHKQGYLNGVFASQRIHSHFPYSREDENVFFSSAIVFTLQEYQHQFSKENSLIADEIIHKVIACYPSFKNFKGGNTYNFFKTNPMDFFPNGKVMQHFKTFKLADDADDTAYVYLTDPKQKSHQWLHKKLTKHANGTLKWNLFNLEKYKDLKAYSVYFGKKMHIEIDICVLSNILLWAFKNSATNTEQHNDSVAYILKAITSKDYINQPYLVAPCYPTTPQITYHISRLLKTYNNDVLSVLKPLLINDLKNLIPKSTLFIDQLFYHISLMNLGIKPKFKLNYQLDYVLSNTDFFYTSLPLMIPKLWARKYQKHNFFNLLGLRTTCDAYTTCLLLEYELLYLKF